MHTRRLVDTFTKSLLQEQWPYFSVANSVRVTWEIDVNNVELYTWEIGVRRDACLMKIHTYNKYYEHDQLTSRMVGCDEYNLNHH